MAQPTVSSDAQHYVVAVEGLAALDFDEVPERVKKFASRAINTTARRYRTKSAKAMREQIAFPARYLTGAADGRLRIPRFASPEDLSATIRGRGRPTSLATFVRGPKVHGRKAPTVEVAAGRREKMNRAFLMNLRNGNLGLAVRLAPGEKIENKRRMVLMNNGLYLLYGPSVDQVFNTVAEDVSEDAADFLEQEFTRMSEALL
ncbi:hypothetical protein [Shimia sp.]|uniref:hypothetical protein n=1 Tax=Shimia sp. TaxID=1954381 RepID=UPI003299929C